MNDLEKLNENSINFVSEKINHLKFEDLIFNNNVNINLFDKNNKSDLLLIDYNLQQFNDENINKIKEDLLYYSLPPSILKKINPKNLKNFLISQNYYYFYFTEKFIKSQKILFSIINKKIIKKQNQIPNILNSLNKNNSDENCESNIIINIRKFLYILLTNKDEDNFNDILNKLDNLIKIFKNEFKYNILNNLRLDIYKTIEEIILIFNLTLYNKYKNNNEKKIKIFEKIIKIIKYFKWGLGIGDWAQSPIPNPQSPIPNS